MSHYRTDIYTRTRARIEDARIVASERVFIERAEPLTARTAAEAGTELPIVNLAFAQGRRERETDTAPFKGTATLDIEVLATGDSGQEAAASRDDLLERIEGALFGDMLAWTGNVFKLRAVDDSLGKSRDGDVLVSAGKMSLTLEIATVPSLETEDMVEGIDVDVQTMEPDDETTEITFSAEPEVEEA